jgi:cyclopropane-fatty-acyl-phospholipid synthase
MWQPKGSDMRIMPRLFRNRIRKGSLTLTGPHGFAETFRGSDPGPTVAIHVSDPGLDWKFLINPELRFAEAYMDGVIQVIEGNLRDLLMLLRLNYKHLERGSALALWNRLFRAMRRFHQHNSLWRARHNAAAHYDIGNDLYRLFLDDDLQYSCAYYPGAENQRVNTYRGNETLEQAQLAKKRHIAAKLMLKPGQRVLDIGCGWGGMALYLAQVADVEVLGVTLAEEQLKLARERAEALGLSDRVRFELQDYRNVEGSFDRIVSVGMLEHVGAGNLRTYFAGVGQRLTSGGVALIHSITAMEPPGFCSPFARKYIFPGGYSPAVSETLAAIEHANLWLLDCEVWRKHYAYTIREWSRRFAANRDAAKALYDERFCRMWEFYLAGAETAFLADTSAVMQLQLGHERDAAPLSRDYMAAETERLQEREHALRLG